VTSNNQNPNGLADIVGIESHLSEMLGWIKNVEFDIVLFTVHRPDIAR
jgi:hypothetical protein